MSLIIALQSAVSALQVNQQHLEIISNNVANANTEGYTRKTLSQETRVLDGQGAGVLAGDVSRHVDENLLKEFRVQSSQLGAFEIRDGYFERMQDLFGTLLNDASIAAIVTDFGNTLEAFAINPEGSSQRLEVINAAVTLTRQMSRMGAELQELRGEADVQITQAIDIINAQLVIVDELNRNIARNLAVGLPAGALQDQRDVAINKIAEQIDISYFTRDSGEIVILTSSGKTLLDREPQFLSHDPSPSMDAAITHADGGVSAILLGGIDITNEIRSGRIGGLIEARDVTLPDLVAQLDRLTAMLRDELNALHNDGTAFPPPNTLTGTHAFSAADTLVASGTVRIAVADGDGAYVDNGSGGADFVDIDLAALTAAVGGTPTVQDVIDAINGGVIAGFDGVSGATASLIDGHLVIQANDPSYGIVVNGSDTAVTVAGTTRTFSHFFGLNDFFTTATDYDVYSSAPQNNAATPLALSGTLTFSGAFTGSPATIAYATGDSLTSIAAAINADATLGSANISAAVVTEGSKVRLRIVDEDGNNFMLTDGGALLSGLGFATDTTGIVRSFTVRQGLVDDPARLSHGTLDNAVAPAIGGRAITAGDNTIAQAMASKFAEDLAFVSAGGLPATAVTLASYATQIVALNSVEAANTKGTLNVKEALVRDLSASLASVSGVNIDEELANMILFQNAYSASARLISVVSEMLRILTEIV